MKRNLKVILSIAFMFTLTSCGKIDAVKSGTLSFNEALTVEDALDNRNICESTSWSEEETPNKIVFVEYVCDVADVNSATEIMRNHYLKQEQDKFDKEMHDADIEMLEAAIHDLNEENFYKEDNEKNIDLTTVDLLRNLLIESVKINLSNGVSLEFPSGDEYYKDLSRGMQVKDIEIYGPWGEEYEYRLRPKNKKSTEELINYYSGKLKESFEKIVPQDPETMKEIFEVSKYDKSKLKQLTYKEAYYRAFRGDKIEFVSNYLLDYNEEKLFLRQDQCSSSYDLIARQFLDEFSLFAAKVKVDYSSAISKRYEVVGVERKEDFEIDFSYDHHCYAIIEPGGFFWKKMAGIYFDAYKANYISALNELINEYHAREYRYEESVKLLNDTAITDIREILQFTINKDDSFEVSYAGCLIEFNNGETQEEALDINQTIMKAYDYEVEQIDFLNRCTPSLSKFLVEK